MGLIIDFITKYWVDIMATGSLGGISIYAIVNAVRNKKTIINFDVLGDNYKEIEKGFKNIGKVIYDELNVVKESFKEVVGELQVAKEDNKILKDLLITTLSVANVPLEQKKTFYNTILKISKASDLAVLSLKESIDLEEEQKLIENDLNDEIDDIIEGIAVENIENI